MAGKQNFESLLEYIVNGEQAKAEELFHQLVVAKSREIYENLLDEEMEDEDLDETADEDDDDAVEESADEDDDDLEESSDDEEIEEMFNFEEADEEDDSEDDDSVGDDGDASDMGDEFGPEGETDDDGMEFGDDEGGEPTMMDLKSDIEELKDMFAQMLDAERHEEENEPGIHGEPSPLDGMDGEMDDMDGEDEDEGMMMPFEEQIDAIDLSPAALMREYVDKVGEAYKGGKVAGTTEGQPVGATNSSPSTTNAKSTVASKNDMGGTAKNIAQGGTEKSPVEANKGELRGSGLLKGKPQDMNTGNVNKVGGTNVKQFYKNNTKGHGAEKKGAGEVGGTDKKSLLGK